MLEPFLALMDSKFEGKHGLCEETIKKNHNINILSNMDVKHGWPYKVIVPKMETH